jgi:hypothetical protein
VQRLIIAVKSIKEPLLRLSWKTAIEKFVTHYVWHTSDIRRGANNRLWQRLESRLIEMKERRKRLLRSLFKKEQKLSTNQEFEKDHMKKEKQKNVIIQGFSAS